MHEIQQTKGINYCIINNLLSELSVHVLLYTAKRSGEVENWEVSDVVRSSPIHGVINSVSLM